MDQKILDRIQKCLNLAESTNPNEAAVALGMAQKLMAEHNVDQLDLQLADITATDVETPSSVSKMKPHELILVHGVAKVFSCKVLWTPGAFGFNGRFTLVGTKDQVQLAVYSCSVLLRRLKKARNDFSIQLGGKRLIGREKTAELDTYCRGWSRAATEKAAALAKMDDQKKELLDRYCETRMVMDEKPKNNLSGVKKGSYSSFLRGIEDGGSEDLHRPMVEDRHNRVGQTLKIGSN